jgi:hypothetical protein
MTLVAAFLATAWPSYAQQQGPGRRGDRGEQMRPPPQPPQPPRDLRPPDRGQNRPGPGHLSPEQREQLRRDIYDHGRDIYRDRKRR